MAIVRTYQIQVGDEVDAPIVEVTAGSEIAAYKMARKQAGVSERTRVRVQSSTIMGAKTPDYRDYTVGVNDSWQGSRPVVRAQEAHQAEVSGRLLVGDAFDRIESSRYVTDAKIVREDLAGSGEDVEAAADRVGRPAKYTENAFDIAVPEHFVFEDGSVLDMSGENDYPDLREMVSSLGEAAWEQHSADFHAGDSGFKDSGSDYLKAHEDRAELRSKDNIRPTLIDAPAEPAQAQEGPGAEPGQSL